MAEETKKTSDTVEDKSLAKKAVKKTTKSATAKKSAASQKAATAKKSAAAKKKTVTKKTVVKKSPARKKAATTPKVSKEEAVAPDVIEAEIVQKSTSDTGDNTKEEAAYNASTKADADADDGENVFPGLDKDRDWKGFTLRIAYIVTFGILGWLAFGAAITMTIIQVIITVLLGAPNETLQKWVSAIGKYLAEVFEYISWNTDEKPFPLGRPAPLEEPYKP